MIQRTLFTLSSLCGAINAVLFSLRGRRGPPLPQLSFFLTRPPVLLRLSIGVRQVFTVSNKVVLNETTEAGTFFFEEFACD